MATSRVYTLFQNITLEQNQEESSSDEEEKSEHAYDDKDSGEAVGESEIKREQKPKKLQDIKDLFNAWNNLDDEGEPDDLQGAEAWTQHEMPEQALDAGDVAFSYDEWDRELSDFRTGWCRVIEKKVRQGDRNFVELARSRYRGVISSIRHQFQLMKPENLTKINREIDGEDYDLNALVDYVIDRKAAGYRFWSDEHTQADVSVFEHHLKRKQQRENRDGQQSGIFRAGPGDIRFREGSFDPCSIDR